MPFEPLHTLPRDARPVLASVSYSRGQGSRPADAAKVA